MKKILLFLLLFTCFSQVEAQRVTVSDEMTMRTDRAFYLLGRLEDNMLVFRDRPGSYEVQAFDEDLRKSWDKTLQFERNQVDIIDVIPGEKDFFVVYVFRKKGNAFLKVRRYDAAAEVIDTSTVIDFGFTITTPASRVKVSENRETILIYQRPSNSELEVVAFSLKEMKGLWSDMLTITGIPFSRDYESFLVSDDGQMYYIMEEDNRRFKLKKHRFIFYKFGPGMEKVRFFEVSMEGKLSYDVRFTYDNVNDFVVGMGLYAEKNLNRAEGYYMLRISNENPEYDRLSFEEFGSEVINVYEGGDAKKGNGIVETDIQELVLRRDGGVLMFAEYVKTYRRPMISGASMGLDGRRYLVDYNYEDVIVVSMHPDGTPHWETVLHKKQYSQDDDGSFSSFFLLKTPQALRMIYNDEIRNENTVSEYIINGRGDFERNAVLSTENQDIRLQFKDALQIGSNELLVPSFFRRRLRLVHIVF